LLFAMLLVLTAQPTHAQTRLEVEAPADLKPLLERYVSVYRDGVESLPDDEADRIALIRRTRREMRELLATEGYFSPSLRFDRSTAGVAVLRLDPGPRATIAEVLIEFEGELADGSAEHRTRIEALRGAWSLPVGKPFRQADWDAAKEGLLDAVSRREFAAAALTESRAEVDPELATVQVHVKIDSGPRYTLGALKLEGLDRYPEDVVRQLSTIAPGSVYDRDALLALQNALQATPYFGAVSVAIDRSGASPRDVPVVVTLAEAQSQRIGFGAGFSTNTGARLEASYRNVNFRRRGWELLTGLRLEQSGQLLFGDILFPRAAGAPRYSVGAQLERSDIQGLRLDTQAIGAARSAARGNIETRIALKLQNEQRRPDGAPASRGTTLSANWSWTRRAVDDLLDPRHGTVLAVEIGGASRALLSDQNFARLYGRVVRYQPVGQRDSLILRAEGGITLAESRQGIPQDFLFRAGGAQSVRGYAYRSLGVEEGDATVGGRYLATLSAEYVHWLDQQWGVAGFVDAGNAADDRLTFRLLPGYGAGARWRSPAGPLAVDLAYGQEERKLRLHLSIAVAF
jgi:translocation and assembly module TamA